jgi:hypothetical protein
MTTPTATTPNHPTFILPAPLAAPVSTFLLPPCTLLGAAQTTLVLVSPPSTTETSHGIGWLMYLSYQVNLLGSAASLVSPPPNSTPKSAWLVYDAGGWSAPGTRESLQVAFAVLRGFVVNTAVVDISTALFVTEACSSYEQDDGKRLQGKNESGCSP